MSTPMSAVDAPVSLGLKARLKRRLQAMPVLWSAYWRTKQQLRRIALLRYFLYDIRHTYRAMFWHEGHTDRVTLSSELLFQYHKLEKGLVMPGAHRMFGGEPALATVALCWRWIQAGHPRTDPVFVGAMETLAAYQQRVEAEQLERTGLVMPHVRQLMLEVVERDAALQTPRPLPRPADGLRFSSFAELAQARRSVREFLPDLVRHELIEQAVKSAQLSPSACNRQPCRVYLVNDPEKKRTLLSYQNGNRGFGHLVPHVAIVTAEERSFFDASERHEPYIDGGLFAMSFILALRDQGVASCCLNWCVPPGNDRVVHEIFGIPWSQRIVMLLAIGYAPERCMVPRSPRRDTADVLRVLG